MTGISLAQHIGENVHALRRALGLSQADLAAEMASVGFGWLRQTVSETEAGHRDATIEELIGLAGVFDVPLARLVGRLEPPFGADPKVVLVGDEEVSVDDVRDRVARHPDDVDQGSFAERRREVLEARSNPPGPTFLFEGEGDLQRGVVVPPWGASVLMTLQPGVPYVARDEFEAEELSKAIDEGHPLRVIDRQTAYRIRKKSESLRERLIEAVEGDSPEHQEVGRGTHQKG